MHAAIALILTVLAGAPQDAPKDQYLYLFSKYDTDGFQGPAEPGGGNLGDGGAFDPTSLPAGRRWIVRTLAFGEVTLLRPKTDGANKNFLSCRGQTIQVSTQKRFNVVFFLGAATEAGQSGWIECRFEDDTTARAPFGLSARAEGPGFGEHRAFELRYLATASDGDEDFEFDDDLFLDDDRTAEGDKGSLWLQASIVPASKRLRAIRLPDLPAIKIAAITLGYRAGYEPAPVEASRPPPEPSPVAIFDEPRFRSNGPSLYVSPHELQTALRAAGIESSLVRVADLVDPQRFSAERFPVYVHLDGSYQAAAAVDAVSRYRAAGGSVVRTSGRVEPPLAVTAYGDWLPFYGAENTLPVLASSSIDSRAELRAVDTRAGLDRLPWSTVKAGSMRSSAEGWWIAIDAARAPKGYRVEPLVTIGDGDECFAALLRPGDGSPAGVDLWVGTSLLADDWTRTASFWRSFLVRATALALHENGRIDAAALETAIAASTPSAEPAAPIAVDADWLHEPRVRGGGVEIAFVLDARKLWPDERILAQSAQGLFNRRGGDEAIYLVTSRDDQRRLGRWVEQGLIDVQRRVDLAEVLRLVGHRRAVVVDPFLRGSLDLATMVAAVEGVLVAYPEVIARHGLEIAIDLRGVFSNSAEILGFVRDDLMPQLDRSAIAWTSLPLGTPSQYGPIGRDLMIARRMLVLSTTSPSSNEPRGTTRTLGSRPSAERRALESILARTSAPGIALGEFGDDLPRLFTFEPKLLLGGYGKIACDARGPNHSFALALDATFAPPTRTKAAVPSLERDKVYVAVVDRPRLLGERSSLGGADARWPRSRVFRTGYHDLFGALACDDFRTATPSDTFGLEVPGGGILDVFGRGIRGARGDVLRALFRALGTRMKEGGFRFLWSAGSPVAARRGWRRPEIVTALEALPSNAPIFVDVPSTSPLSAATLAGSTPVFRTVGQAQLLEVLEAGRAPDVLPLFLFTTEQELAALDDDFDIADHVTFVRPDALAALYCRQLESWDPIVDTWVESGSDWRYHDAGEDLGASWRVRPFDDAKWKAGSAPLGYGDDDVETTLSFGDDSSDKHPCYYFRRTFDLDESDVSGERGIPRLRMIVDDGCIVWINGKEACRYNMPAGDIAFATLADKMISGSPEDEWVRRTLDPGLFRVGRNVIAVEVHQQRETSSDVSFDLELSKSGWAARKTAKR